MMLFRLMTFFTFGDFKEGQCGHIKKRWSLEKGQCGSIFHQKLINEVKL